MPKKSLSLFALAAGAVAGAAAVFFSKKENRVKAKAEIKKAAKTVKKVKAQSQKMAKKVVKKASKKK